MPDSLSDGQDELPEAASAAERGDSAALEALIAAVYPDLKRLAHFQLAKERHGHTLNTTAIVHEAYVRLSSANGGWTNRGHFLRAASTVMRHLLVDYARMRSAGKRGGGSEPITLEDGFHSADDDGLAVLALDDAIRDISEIDERLGRIIECRYFAGLSVSETAEALDMAVRTVEREWQRAKGYLLQAMASDES